MIHLPQSKVNLKLYPNNLLKNYQILIHFTFHKFLRFPLFHKKSKRKQLLTSSIPVNQLHYTVTFNLPPLAALPSYVWFWFAATWWHLICRLSGHNVLIWINRVHLSPRWTITGRSCERTVRRYIPQEISRECLSFRSLLGGSVVPVCLYRAVCRCIVEGGRAPRRLLRRLLTP